MYLFFSIPGNFTLAKPSLGVLPQVANVCVAAAGDCALKAFGKLFGLGVMREESWTRAVDLPLCTESFLSVIILVLLLYGRKIPDEGI